MQPFFKLSLTLLLFISTSYGRILEPKESAKNNPGLQTSVDKATNSYLMHHTMLRIKDPKRSLDFYSRIMGMSLLKRFDFRELRFSTYLMGYEDTSTAPSDPLKRTAWAFRQNNIIELTHNWGTENNASFTGYHNGNTEPLGYGHVAINVDDVQKAIKRFDNLGVDFVRRPPNDKGIAFIRDPDGYWIEIFDIASVVQVTIDTNSA